MAATQNQPVNFVVKSIEKGYKKGFVGLRIVFNGSSKQYDYFRKSRDWLDKETNTKCKEVTISGCAVLFTEELEYIKTVRLYDVAGKKMLKRYGKSSDTAEETAEVEAEVETKAEEEAAETAEAAEAAEATEATEATEAKEAKEEVVEKDADGNVKHCKYDIIKSCLECDIPVYLAGPAGSGKNFTVEQIAWDLGWDFYFSNSVQQEYKLTGFIDAGGNFHDTEFYKACTSEKDCIFFLDEIDASIPEVLVLLNAAIANGYFEFPTGRVDLKHVHFVAAGNTVGTGADESYTGRMVIDQATLDRFAIIEFDYDRNIELAISNNNVELVDFIRSLRDCATSNGIRATFSYRCITMVTKLEQTKMALVNIIKIAVVKGLDQDTVSTLYVSGDSKYASALSELANAA